MKRSTMLGGLGSMNGVVGMALALVAGCSENHVRESDAGPVVVTDAPPPIFTPDGGPPALPDAPREIVTERLATCLAAGRGLREVAVVDNNDTTDHGALLRLGLSPTGLVAAAGEDGTLKLWTLDAELLETFDGTILTYGPEIPAAPIADITFDGESILVGDIRGIVLQLDRGGSLFPIGGTTPEIPIRAVAFDPTTRRLVHAQSGDVPPLVVRAEDGTTMDVTTELLVSDLAFTDVGTLLVAGERGGHPVIESRDLAMNVVGDGIELGTAGGFVEIAYVAARGESGARVVGVTPTDVFLGDVTVAHAGGRSIALATDAVSTVALVAGANGLDALEAVGAPGTSLFHLDGDAVTVRVDPTGTLAVLGDADATIHVLACAD